MIVSTGTNNFVDQNILVKNSKDLLIKEIKRIKCEFLVNIDYKRKEKIAHGKI